MSNLSKEQEKQYEEYVKNVTPTTSLAKNMFGAFLVGGLICLLGQILYDIFKNQGYSKDDATSYELVILVALSAITTGMGLYQRLAKFAGAGTLVPITGFANSVASPAVEFGTEGQVFGIGCQIFKIAGPVILYGIFASWLLGLIYYFISFFQGLL